MNQDAYRVPEEQCNLPKLELLSDQRCHARTVVVCVGLFRNALFRPTQCDRRRDGSRETIVRPSYKQ